MYGSDTILNGPHCVAIHHRGSGGRLYHLTRWVAWAIVAPGGKPPKGVYLETQDYYKLPGLLKLIGILGNPQDRY
jgi:hypothetical protein